MRTIFELLLHDGIYRDKSRGSVVGLTPGTGGQTNAMRRKKGAIGVTRSKEDLSSPAGVRGYVIRTLETLLDDCQNLTHWTPNAYNYLVYSDDARRHLKGHTETNLQQINAFVVDIDSKTHAYTEILTAALDHSVGVPTMVLETPKGYQAYFVLDSPLYISDRNDFRGLKVAKRISENIRRSLSAVLPGVDIGCNDFGFFRVPTNENVRWFSEALTFSINELIGWSMRQDDDRGRGLFVVESPGPVSDPTDAAWFRALLSTRHVEGCSGQLGRDNVMYTLALSCYGAGKGHAETADLLAGYNASLDSPLRTTTIRKIVTSAFKGRFKGASGTYIQALLEAWVPEQDIPVVNSAGGWHKFKKQRKNRIRSHYDEWEADLLAYLDSVTSPESPILWTTQRGICEVTGIPRSSFNEMLRRSKMLLIKRSGKGRYAKTGLTSVAILLACALAYNQQHRANYYQAVSVMYQVTDNQLGLQILGQQIESMTQRNRNRAAPTVKLNSS